jgi:hypothetical protein
MTKTLKKIINDEDLKETCFNTTIAWGVGNLANIVANSIFKFNLNQYNSITHFTIGVGIGTFTYRKAGGGVKGVLAGLITATAFNGAWEAFENGYVFHNNVFSSKETDIDTISDIGILYAGSVLSFLGEKAKDYINRDKIKRNERWVL